MSLNCAEIDLILRELALPGSFVQDIVQPGFDSLALHVYKGAQGASGGEPKTVFFCLTPGACRVHETRRRIPKHDRPLRFMEFLRSRIRGARIDAVDQPDANRVVRVSLSRAGERLFLYARLWSGAANIVLTDETGGILDVFFRRPKRGEVSGGTWELPPPPAPNGPSGTVGLVAGVASSVPAGTASAAPAGSRWSVRELPGEGSFNERIDRWYAEHAEASSREALLSEARRRHALRMARLDSALSRLEKKRAAFLDADLYRKQGDLLTANLHLVKPGMPSVEVSDYERDGVPTLITLDPRLKPQENAALYYERYRKAVSGLSDLEDDIASTRRTMETLSAELASLEEERNPLVIQKALRKRNTPRQQLKRKYPGLVFRVDGWLILVGRTAAENDELLRRHVKGSDLWLHTRDWPGGYVFVKNRPGKSVPLGILLDAGTLALFYSKGRKAGNADLYYAQVKHLRRAKGAPRGTVLPSNEKNLSVSLDDARLKRLEACKDEE